MSNFLTGLANLNPQVKQHNGGTSTLTLDQTGTTNATQLFISGVFQVPGTDFTVSGTTLTTTTAIPSGTNIATTIQYFNTGIVNVPADDSVTGGKLDIPLVAGDIIYASGTDTLARLAKGTDDEILTLASGVPSWAVPASEGATEVTAQALSGSSNNFTVDSSARRIVVSIDGLSTGANNQHSIRLGDAGGVEATGYVGSARTLAGDVSLTTGFPLGVSGNFDASGTMIGNIILERQEGSTLRWICSYATGNGGQARSHFGGGAKSLSAVITTVQIFTAGTFDAGTVSLTWET